MITTSTGAKKLESSDNWREIFPNPGTSAAGAHNASVDAHDRIQAEVAPIINGKRCSLGAASGEYVLLRNSTITGKTDGAYQATKAIPANTDLDSTYLGSPITGGLVNELNSKIMRQTLYNSTTVQVFKAGNVFMCSFQGAKISDIVTALQNVTKPSAEVRSMVWNYTDVKAAIINVVSSSVFFIDAVAWSVISDTNKVMHGQVVWEV